MFIKLILYGTLGYVGLKLLKSAGGPATKQANSYSDLRIAGGPLSSQATIQHSADAPPA